MYRQIRIHPEDAKYQSILWSNENNDESCIFQLDTVTYGTKPAPYLAQKCTKVLSEEYKAVYPLGAKVLKDDIYVDDVFSGADLVEELFKKKHELISLLQKANMKLHKWCSNSTDLLTDISEDTKQKLITIEDGLVTKTLGLTWDPSHDWFLFDFHSLSFPKKLTKRSALSLIASLFDPLGLINPVIVSAKIFMQSLWKFKLSWDESLPLSLHTQFENLVFQLKSTENLKISRYVLNFPYFEVQIHGFSDASQVAYGACLYARCINSKNEAQTYLLCAKSRVAPIRTISIARLELCAALVLVELLQVVLTAIPFSIDKINCWTDSTIVLSWIRADASNWSTFVANRVSKIQEISEEQRVEWRHVRSEDNPADILSRGCYPSQLKNNPLWFEGPTFLKNSSDSWPTLPKDLNTDEERKSIVLVSINQLTDLVQSTKFIKSYTKTIRIFSYVYLFISKCRKRYVSDSSCSASPPVLSQNNIIQGEICCIKAIQYVWFHNEVLNLQKGCSIPKNSAILNLNPFLDKHGLIRVGGRLKHSSLLFDTKYPILLPKSHEFTLALIKHFHFKNLHAGIQTLTSVIRQRYWIPSIRQNIRSVIHLCLICFRCKPTLQEQLMGDLPENRVRASFPFCSTGVDFCGPITVKQFTRSKIQIKCYIAIFICFLTKAVHIEIVPGLTTEAFISSLKRFISRRGKPACIISDNATNFVGAKKELQELKKLYTSQNHNNEMFKYCAEEGIEWKTIPPRSPHFGGLWEASVKLAKYHLTRMLINTKLNFEELTTLTCQIEAVINSRPLTPISNDINDYEALTPSHFLIGRPTQIVPEPDCSKTSTLSRYQLLSKLHQDFWKRWSTEYLTTLQTRNKWKTTKPNVSIGSLVLLKDENLPSTRWPLARIKNVFPGSDGNVRVVEVMTSSNATFKRPIHKICVLPIDKSLNIEVPSSRGEC